METFVCYVVSLVSPSTQKLWTPPHIRRSFSHTPEFSPLLLQITAAAEGKAARHGNGGGDASLDQ